MSGFQRGPTQAQNRIHHRKLHLRFQDRNVTTEDRFSLIWYPVPCLSKLSLIDFVEVLARIM